MTLRDAVIKSLKEINKATNYKEVCEHVMKNNYYDFGSAETPMATVSATLGGFIRNGDDRVRRIKISGGKYLYYLAQNESELKTKIIYSHTLKSEKNTNKTEYAERDLHKLLSSYLKNINIYSKTIFHEQSKNSKDSNQKWIHPDMIGISFLNLQSKTNQAFLKSVNKNDLFKLTSYEIKREINTDYDLKQAFFQAVSNSSWANYGYLVAFEISDNLNEEVERLSQAFGIGIIELKSNPYESKIIYPAKLKELDFKTIDKLCNINSDFENFISQVEKHLSAEERYLSATEKELDLFCDSYFKNDSEVEEYCHKNHIPTDITE